MKLVTSLLRDKLWQSFFGVVLVFLLTVAYLFSAVLDTPLLGGTKKITVEMASTGGLFEGSAVTYRGVKIGKVRTIKLTEAGVVATIAITSKDKIPVASVAQVRSLSPVGEQYLDFQPTTTSAPYLKDGSVVPASSTDLPKTLASTVIAVNKVLDQIDTDQLRTVLVELSTGLAGTGEDLGKLVDQGRQLLVDLNSVWPETNRLLSNAGAVLDIGPSRATEIRELASTSRQFAAFLKNYDPELRRTLDAAPEQIKQLQALVTDAGAVLPGFLDQAVPFSDLIRPYAPHLGALLAGYGPGLGVLGKAIRDGTLYIEGIPQRPVTCPYDIERRDPKNPQQRPLVNTGKCSPTTPHMERSADKAPGPVK